MKDYWFCISENLKTSLHGDATPHNITQQRKRMKKRREPKCCVNDNERWRGRIASHSSQKNTSLQRAFKCDIYEREVSHPSTQKSWSLLQKQPNIKDRMYSKGNNCQGAVLEIQSECVEWTPEPALQERNREETAPRKRAVMKPMKSSERLGFQKQLQLFKRNLFTMEIQSNRYRELRRNVEINERLLHSHTKQFTFQLFISKTSNPSNRCLLCCCML